MVHFDRLLIPEQYLVSRTEYNTIISIPTRYFFNDHAVNKTVTLTHDGTWTLSIGGRTALDVSRLGLQKRYSASMLPALLRLVDDMRLCVGKKCSTVVTGVSRRSMLRCTTPFFENAVSTLKSKACHQVLCFTATSHCCRPCQRISLRELPVPIPHSNIDSIADTSALQTILREIIPHCPNSFHDLIVSQHDAHAAKSNRGVRWGNDMIRLCLSLYCRSPSTYHQLGASCILKLPSGRLLSMYKNTVQQAPGLQEEVFKWMHDEAQRLALSNADRQGGIVIDEMAIQPDLQMVRDNGI